MSEENSNAQAPQAAERDASQEPVTQAAFSIPDDLAKRYEIRAIEGRSETERRVGLFTPGNAQTPALEISNERIVANRDDRETVENLVKLAQHNGWEGISVDGSPEFRKAVWQAAARSGLEVNGYDPSFAEREAVERQRREEAERERKDAQRLRNDDKAERNGEAEQVVEAAEIAIEAATPNALSEFLASKDKAQATERESEKLADLYLSGTQAQRQAEPRLANALEAEAEMRRHLEAAFEGDDQRIEAVSQEGRQMISDVLRRGLDVSVREPAPVRQIEPIQTNQMER